MVRYLTHRISFKDNPVVNYYKLFTWEWFRIKVSFLLITILDMRAINLKYFYCQCALVFQVSWNCL